MGTGPVSVVSLTELLNLPDDRDALAITFDDAFTNFQTHAWPRLREYGLPVTVFTPTGFVGRTNSWAAIPGGGMPTLSILDWTSLAGLQEDGVTLGAHSRTHPDLRTLSDTAIEDEVLGQLRTSGGRRAVPPTPSPIRTVIGICAPYRWCGACVHTPARPNCVLSMDRMRSTCCHDSTCSISVGWAGSNPSGAPGSEVTCRLGRAYARSDNGCAQDCTREHVSHRSSTTEYHSVSGILETER